MLLNSNQINYSIPCDNDKFFEKEKKDIKKTNSLKIELQEPKEEIMHLLSPNKSNKKISEDDIYKTEMNNKKPIEIFQDTTANNKEKKVGKYYDLQYLIDKNKTEKIDFITTLLKLKGIKTEEDKKSETNFKIKNITNNNTDGDQSNISTNFSKINSENQLINNNNSTNENIININQFNISNKIDENNNQSVNDIINNKTLYVNKSDYININSSKKLLRFCSSMMKNRKKAKIYNSSKSSKKRINKNNNINDIYKEKKVNNYINIFNNVTINNTLNINNIRTNNMIDYLNNLNDKNSNILYSYKIDLSKKKLLNNQNKKSNIILYQNYNIQPNDSISKQRKSVKEINKTLYTNNEKNDTFYKKRSKSIIQIDEKTTNKKSFNHLNNNNNPKKKNKQGYFKSHSQLKDITKNISRYNNNKTQNNSINKYCYDDLKGKKITNLKQSNIISKERYKNEYQGFLTSKSNLLSFLNDNEKSECSKSNIKNLKNRFNYNDTFNNTNNLNIFNYKERRSKYCINNDLIPNCIDYKNVNDNNIIKTEKKNLILKIEINEECFSKKCFNNSNNNSLFKI